MGSGQFAERLFIERFDPFRHGPEGRAALVCLQAPGPRVAALGGAPVTPGNHQLQSENRRVEPTPGTGRAL